ncbi:MAG: hypothetical protein H8E61_04875 [Bacteroidetes bacterium]|nr:hypothetical protein [Bacteroidota bacterium]
MKKQFILSIAILMVISFSNCKKELDLSTNEYYDVSDFLKSKNCQTKCGIQASCEGKKIRLQGIIDEINVMPSQHVFYLKDHAKDKFKMEIKVDSVISEVIFDLIQNQLSGKYRIEGIVEGFDKPTNFTCERGYFMHLIKESDLSIY